MLPDMGFVLGHEPRHATIALRCVIGHEREAQDPDSKRLASYSGDGAVSYPMHMHQFFACKNGLGRHRGSLDDSSYVAYSKLLYAGQILALLSLSVAKLSATYLIVTIEPFKALWIDCMAVIGVVAAWTIAGVISFAVQCDIPQPWHFNDGRCVVQEALYLGLGVIGILTDVALVVLPIVLAVQVQLSLSKRATIIALFSSRIVLTVVTAVTLARLEDFVKSSDKPCDAVGSSIWLQATLGLSLITTCISYLKRVLENLQSGLAAGTISEFHELSRTEDTGAHGYSTGSKSGGRSSIKLSAVQLKATADGTVDGYLRPDYAANKGHGFVNSIIGGGKHTRKVSRGNIEGDSESVQNLTGSGITQTIEYEVRRGERPESRSGVNKTGASSAASSETCID